jgi:hypothetical protein
VTPRSGRRTPLALSIAIGAVAAIGGTIAAWHYHRVGLTLTHYDARGHLVVARRIIDNITPGWQQIGAVWLPLPHLLNALPVQIDLFYRTGASAVAISVASFAIAAGAIAWIVFALTGSIAVSLAATALFAFNPNVIYLQSTPMTEPLLLATTTVAVAMLIAWCDANPRSPERLALHRATVRGRSTSLPEPRSASLSEPRSASLSGERWPVGIAFALACLTRYEAWPVTASALAAAIWTRWRRGQPLQTVWREVGAIALYPAIAVAGFAIFSRVVVGQWFVGGDFFVPENKALDDPTLALKEIGWGTVMLSGEALTWIGGIGLMVAFAWGLFGNERSPQLALRRGRTSALIVLSLVTMAAVPWAAFYRGHPFRIRYMVPLMAIEAIGAGIAAGAIADRRVRAVCIVALLAIAGYELRPLDATAPMVVEAQWDRPNTSERARVTACIGRLEPGAKIMASMGSLGHYMQEMSRSGFAIRDFLHEGNGDIWLAALERPQPFAAWMLIEEKAQGGDMLARIAHERPSFLAGYERVCDGAGLALYRRVPYQNLKFSVNE